MKGKVEQYFMTFIALDLKCWTVETLGQGLFNYCFSPAFRRQMRVKFQEFMEGKQIVKEYLRQLKLMDAWLPDITDFQLMQKYWDGANSYLHLKWTENGFTPEFSDISELELAAKRYENAEQLQAYKQR